MTMRRLESRHLTVFLEMTHGASKDRFEVSSLGCIWEAAGVFCFVF